MYKKISGIKQKLAGIHESLWLATTPDTSYPSLEGDATVDVAIIGGGIVGITSAFLLKSAGLTVAVIEADKVIKGVSGYTTAKVTSLHTRIYKHLIDHFGKEQAQQYAQANQTAIEKIATIVHEKGIDCDFVRKPSYTYAETPEHEDKVHEEAEVARSLGLPATFVKTVPLPFKTWGAVRFDNQAQFHPRKYLLELARMIPGNGSFIFEQTRALDMDGNESLQVVTNRGTVTAHNVIVATHFPIFDKSGFYFARMYASRSYVVAARINQALPDGMFIGSEPDELSFRSQRIDNHEIAIITDSEHVTGHEGNTVERYQRLEESVRRIYDLDSIEYRWSTQDNVTIDQVPYIGKLSEVHDSLYVATGFKKWGMTGGTAAAIILSDLIQGRDNLWTSVYSPARFKPLTSGKTLVEQNMNVIRHFASGRLYKPSDEVSALDEGEGKLVRYKDETTAAFKDEQGKVYMLKPACTHMGCIVAWNNGERSWDCPCHGSRFNFDGRVIHSPAIKDLEKIE